MATPSPLTSDILTISELADASGAEIPQLKSWAGSAHDSIVQIYKAPKGFGTRRLFKGAIPILDATEARELTAAGFNRHQIKRRFTVQRAALAGLSDDAALVARYRAYIATIVMLADTFGRGPGYDTWLATQEAQLRRMEQALADTAGPGDHRVLNLLAAMMPREHATKALAG